MSGLPVVFRLSGHSLAYGDHRVLDNISLQIRRGEKVALLGPSGAGKTTLLHILHDQQPEQVALQPQSGGLVDMLSVYQNVFMGGLARVGTLPALWNLLRPLPSHRKAIAALVESLGLTDKLWQSVDRLSGGQRQRVAIGRALYRQQPVFLGDEPVSALDPLQAGLLLELLLERHETAVVSLHDRRLALQHFDRIIVMRDGRISCDCAASALSEAALNAWYRQDEPLESARQPDAADPWLMSRP
ncbi:ATP-binding cassette domain-containing protein [Marinobacterium weihaiense]|uniref:ATP-binding cassette domain-containing protein n=1 Tax=Marinobacterium weihaiense TaxID=2851016 RepID=A0ABS6M936_9GAMM|nr:ATP-binding cassette domain-containing protein [Marinobacterium weihaiense]MBV0932803.1 ATP-binding cassette domain-containing protein [Marinobacterium weihaiense]